MGHSSRGTGQIQRLRNGQKEQRDEGGEGDWSDVKEFRFESEKQNLNISSGQGTSGGVEEQRSADGILVMIRAVELWTS